MLESTTGRSWDALPCQGFGLEDTDRQTIEDFLRKAGQEMTLDSEHVLGSLKLLTSDGLCNSSVLLFALNPQRFVVGAQVKCARFLGTTSVKFLDERTLDGNVFFQLEEAMAFVTRNTRQAIVITGRPEREILPEYPSEAVREAIVNAICHRDYAMAGTVQVRVYDDRLEVWSPGVLPPGISVEDLYREHSSRPRNPLLAAVLHRARLIEHWGTGTLRIVQACEARRMPRPEFLVQTGCFVVRFTKDMEEVPTPVETSLNERQERALEYMRAHGGISAATYRQILGIRKSQAVRDLNDLLARRVIVRVGSGPKTRYVLRSAE